MPNNKPIGVAYADPALDSATVSGAVTAGSVSAASIANTTSTGLQLSFGNGQGFYALTTAITAGVTATTAAAGSLAITSNATGVGKLFASDGSLWQFVGNS